ncbi:hypothetical protein SUGI_0853410 [Cryptomeria japonica]|nr:hypothetical protein SUGI_0853410 [Cryptomeria japonica]
MGKGRYMWGAILILMVACICTASSRRVGGIEDVPNFQQNKEIKSLAKYAVKEYNKQQACFNVALTFSKVVKAQQQVVAGTRYYLTLEVLDGVHTSASVGLFEKITE